MLEVIDHPLKAGGALELAHPRVAPGAPAGQCIELELLRKLMEAIAQGAKESALVVTGQPGIFPRGSTMRGMLELDRDGVTALFIDVWRAQRAIAYSPVP